MLARCMELRKEEREELNAQGLHCRLDRDGYERFKKQLTLDCRYVRDEVVEGV